MTAIREGSLTFEALRRSIGVGTGNCKAKRCRPNIEERIQKYKDSLKAEDEVGETKAVDRPSSNHSKYES